MVIGRCLTSGGKLPHTNWFCNQPQGDVCGLAYAETGFPILGNHFSYSCDCLVLPQDTERKLAREFGADRLDCQLSEGT